MLIAGHLLNVCCAAQNTQIALVTSLVFLAYLYFVFYFFNIRRANRMLANESYAKYKQATTQNLPLHHSPVCFRSARACTFMVLMLQPPHRPGTDTMILRVKTW